VTRVRLSRIFWIGAAATLVVAALIGVAGLLRSEFTETDGKILLTLLALLVAGGAALAGLALLERSSFAFGWFAVVVAVVSFVFITAATWRDFDDDGLTKIAGIAAITLIAVLLVSTQMLLHRGRLMAVAVLTWLALFFAVAGTTIGILGESESDELWKGVGSLWILGLLGWLLVPVLQRFTAAGASAAGFRVLAVLDGVELVASRDALDGVQIEAPAAGERLVLRRQG
jgi:hypothetical protein